MSGIVRTLTKSPKPKLANTELVFGQTFTDHMLTIKYNNASTPKWSSPEIKRRVSLTNPFSCEAYEQISLDPSATVFHYGVACFEGMKAYMDAQNKIRLFRPDMNMKRFAKSCERLGMQSYNTTQLLECIKELCRVEKRWIPKEKGYSLYIRPTAIATQPSLGVGVSKQSMVMVICSPVGPYYRTGFAAVSLYADSGYVRAWPGGTGDAKIGGNYAPGIVPQIVANEKGYQQVLWLFGKEDYITEGSLTHYVLDVTVGTMNFFVYMKDDKGIKTLITPSLDGTILPGVTRDSIIHLSKQWGIKVEERPITMKELCNGLSEKRVMEVFGAGTAAIVSPVKKIFYGGRDWDVPLDISDSSKQAGPLTSKFAETIMDIQYGVVNHEWSVVID